MIVVLNVYQTAPDSERCHPVRLLSSALGQWWSLDIAEPLPASQYSGRSAPQQFLL
jgi:hypothetical protein